MIKTELVLDSKSLLGEGPWWDHDRMTLSWIDVLGRMIHRYDPAANINNTIIAGQHIGCAVPRKSGGMIACMQDGIYHVDYENNKIEPVCDVEKKIRDNRFNDGKCDSRGRLWFGSMSMKISQGGKFKNRGSFYNYSQKYGVVKVFGDVGISNGIAWSRDDTKMYYIDSLTRSVACFDFDIEKGLLRNKRYIIKIPGTDGLPDGMTIDVEGLLWIAHFGGFQVSRWDPETGEKIGKIELPVPNVTSCIFGGNDLDELYITTAREGLKKEDLKKYPLSGGLFKAWPGIKGSILHKFG
jgi:sugar lactone lactonase YvrE